MALKFRIMPEQILALKKLRKYRAGRITDSGVYGEECWLQKHFSPFIIIHTMIPIKQHKVSQEDFIVNQKLLYMIEKALVERKQLKLKKAPYSPRTYKKFLDGTLVIIENHFITIVIKDRTETFAIDEI